MYEKNKYNLLFIHIPKNSGSAIEGFIEKYNYNTNFLYKNILILGKSIMFWDVFHKYNLNNFVNNTEFIKEFINMYHLKLKNITVPITNDTILFSVIRHPQKRIESLYKFTQAYKYYSFKDFIKKIIQSNYLDFITSPQFYFLCDKYNKKIDKRINILHFELLNKDWKDFCNKYNIEYSPLNKENVSVYNENIIIEWTDKLRKMIYKKYKRDFKTFNYELY